MPRAAAASSGERVTLSPSASLRAYQASIGLELAAADDSLARPFEGLADGAMGDVAVLPREQLEVFRRHVQVEREWGVGRGPSGGVSFGKVAAGMHGKERGTGEMLDRLEGFDAELRRVIGKFEQRRSEGKKGKAGEGMTGGGLEGDK